MGTNESRRLDHEDRVFLSASQELEQANTQTRLDAEAQYSQTLKEKRERAEAELLDARQELNKIRERAEAELLDARQELKEKRERAEAELLDARQELNKTQAKTKRLEKRGREARRMTTLFVSVSINSRQF